MKKVFSVLCILALLLGVTVMGTVGAHAEVDAARTMVDIKSGDEISYTLTLGGVPDKIIGCDFSIYYDADLLTLESFADFSNSTDPENWTATINTNLKGEVRGNWSILSGVNFSAARSFATLNLKAKAAGTAHISYYIRYMYDNSVFESASRPQISVYTFTCDLTLNGNKILEDAQPELNVDEPQKVGTFVNSLNGKGEDANVNTVEKNNDSKTNPTQSATDPSTGKPVSTDPTPIGSSESGTDGSNGSTDTPGASDAAGSSAWIWIVIVAVVVVAGCGIGVYVTKNKKK